MISHFLLIFIVNSRFSRGAELIESLRKKQVKIQAQREEEILQKIKQKMDRIKANQQKLQPTLSAPKTHYQGKLCVKVFSQKIWNDILQILQNKIAINVSMCAREKSMSLTNKKNIYLKSDYLVSLNHFN